MVHRHHDGRASKSAITGGEHAGVGRTHRGEVGPYPVDIHQTMPLEFTALTLLPYGSDDHATRYLVLAVLNNHRYAATILIGFAGLSSDTR